MKRTQRIGDGTPISNAIPGTEPGKHRSRHLVEDDHPKGNLKRRRRANYKPAPVYPDVMPPVPEWDNPCVKRKPLSKGEQRHFAALRAARIEARSDPNNPVIRAKIIRRDRSTCWICKRVLELQEITLDHVNPIALGGLHIPENVKVCCDSCNRWKGDRIITPAP